MEFLTNLLSVNTVFITIIGYPLSYIEFFGTIANLWSVWLIAKKKILTWPIGIVGVLLFLLLFYQIRLYSDMLEQLYYLVTSIWGWWVWQTAKKHEENVEISTSRSTFIEELQFIGLTILGTLGLWRLTLFLPTLLPVVFPEAPSYALLDALTTIMSFVAMYLMIKRKISCWYYWIIVDIIGIGLYYIKDVKLLSLLYGLFLILAIKGLISWSKSNASIVATENED